MTQKLKTKSLIHEFDIDSSIDFNFTTDISINSFKKKTKIQIYNKNTSPNKKLF